MPLYVAGVIGKEKIVRVYKNIITKGIGISRTADNEELLKLLGLSILEKVCQKF